MSTTEAAITDAGAGNLPTATAKSSLRYMPGLDVMRGIAILMVILYHGYANDRLIFVLIGTKSALLLARILSWGPMGVPLFFILSGFLISGILIDSRAQADYFRNFYLRRLLHLVHASLALLAVLFFTHSITIKYLIVCLLYLCNMTGLFGVNAQYGPLWSLSVEEQFYLFWPFVVRKLSTRHLAIFSVGLLFFTPLLRFALPYGPAQLHDTHFKTWDVMDFFASGSCIALAIRSSRFSPHIAKAILPLLVSGIVLFFLPSWISHPNAMISNALNAISLDAWLLFFSGLILIAYLYPRIASVAIARPLVFLGNISYGLYLCHIFVFGLIWKHWPAHITGSLGIASVQFIQFVVQVAASILIATISRYTYEEFFLRMKPKHPGTRITTVPLIKIT